MERLRKGRVMGLLHYRESDTEDIQGTYLGNVLVMGITQNVGKPERSIG